MTLKPTDAFRFEHGTGPRLIARETLRDMPGQIAYRNGITDEATDEELFETFFDVIDGMANRHPDAPVLTSDHF